MGSLTGGRGGVQKEEGSSWCPHPRVHPLGLPLSESSLIHMMDWGRVQREGRSQGSRGGTGVSSGNRPKDSEATERMEPQSKGRGLGRLIAGWGAAVRAMPGCPRARGTCSSVSTGESQGAPPSPAMGGSVLLSRGKVWGKGPSDGGFLTPRAIPNSTLAFWTPVHPAEEWVCSFDRAPGSALSCAFCVFPLPPLSLNIGPAQNQLHFPHASLTCPSAHPLNLSFLPPSSNHLACVSLSLSCALPSFALSHTLVYSRPSVYWTERFLEDTTLAITVPGRLSPPTTSTSPSGVT